MKKNELKSGMIVEYRGYGGIKLLVVGDNLVGEYSYSPLSNYNDDLKDESVRDFDIMKVYKYKKLVRFRELLEDDNLELIWERKEIKLNEKEIKLTDKEVEILKALKILGYEWLARDGDGAIFAYNNKPKKLKWFWSAGYLWYPTKKDEDLFNFIKWEDDEPTKIDDLLKEII